MGCTSQITTTAGQNLPTHHKNLLELATFLTFAKPSPFFANIQLQVCLVILQLVNIFKQSF